MNSYATNFDAIQQAAKRIAPYVHRTPVMTCRTLDTMAGRSLFFKCENFQRIGAFKFRGACNAILKLSDEQAARGVVTHSSGNHAQAVAVAASLRKITAHIVMPTTAPQVKRNAVEGYGATVYSCEPTLDAREKTAQQVIEKTGAVMIPPFDHADIISGQGTCALELLDEVAELDALIAPVGGGGLISGTSITARGTNTSIRVFAAEPQGADDAARSMAAGKLIPQTQTHTIADGLLTSLGQLTWPIIRDHVERIVTVTDDEIISAMHLVWERMKIIIEPSAAVTVAAILSDEFRPLERLSRVGVILSGGNVDLDHLPWHGEAQAGC